MGRCSGPHGYILAVIEVLNISQGLVRQDGTGKATFGVTYKAVALRPWIGEVLDALVSSVNKMGFFADVGPMQARDATRRDAPGGRALRPAAPAAAPDPQRCQHTQALLRARKPPNPHKQNNKTPQIFVSNHLIPDEFAYSATGEPAFVSADASAAIREGAEVRLRVVGIKVDANEIFCIGSMKEDFLGLL